MKMPERFEFPEGATPKDDCSGLIPIWVHHLHVLNRVEAENMMNAQRKYLRGTVVDPKNWFQVRELKAIHQAMFGKMWEWAGVYRKSVTSELKHEKMAYFRHTFFSKKYHQVCCSSLLLHLHSSSTSRAKTGY